MVSLLSRLITRTTTFQCAKLFRSIEKLRYSQSRFNASKTDKESVCPKSQNYITRLAMPVDYENVISFICETYFTQEPSMINMGINNNPPIASLMNLTLELIKHGMTIIAVNSNHYIVGAAINVCSCPWDPKRMMEYAEREEKGSIRNLIEFFAYVSSKPDIWNRYCIYKVFECSNVAVNPEYRGTGIARKLIEESWYLARDCTYRLFRIDCSSRYTARIAQGFGWKKICTIPFCRYIKDGEMVFQHIQEPHTEIAIYVDRVNFLKAYHLPYENYNLNKQRIEKENR